MRNKKYGYILLTLLVVSGLAGTPTVETLNRKERKFAEDFMKTTKADILKSVKDLSERQLNYKPAPDAWSVKECIYHIAISERNLWNTLDESIKKQPNPEKRSEIKLNDKDIIIKLEDRSVKKKAKENFDPGNTPYKSFEEALEDFKKNRTEHIKYVKFTTEDMHNHVTEVGLGWIDTYQVILYMTAHSNRHLQQINEIKADPGFPKK